MPGIEIEDLIRRYDDTIRYRQQLFDYNFAEEANSVLQTCVKNQETFEAQLQEKTKECEYLRECLNIAYDKVAKLYTQFEDRTNYYQGLLKNNHAKEFLDFVKFLNTRNESNEKVKVTLHSEGDDLSRRYEDLCNDNLVKALNDDNIKDDFEALKLKFDDKTDECDQLKIRLNEANEHISTLNSDLKAAHESLNAEKVKLNWVGSERDNLERSLLKYQLPVHPVDETEETQNRTPSHHFAINEDNLIEINSEIDFDHGLPISPPSNFRDDDVTVEEIDPHEFFSEKQEHHAETNTLEETSNSSVWRKLWKRMPTQSSNYFASESTSSLTAALSESPMPDDIADIEIDHNLHFVQESYDVNSPVDNSKSTAVKNCKAIDVLENSVIDPAMQKLSEPLKTNETPVASQTLPSDEHMRKSISQTDALPKSITPVESHFTCDISGKSFLKKSGLVCHMRVHMNSAQSFHCEKCGESFVAKRRGKNLVKCPNCDVRYNTRNHKTNFETISDLLETKKNDQSADVDNIHGEREHGNSNECDVRCDICGKSYSSNSAVKKHIQQVHEEKRHECTTCGKRFTQKWNLKIHAAVHGSDKPFKCSVCNKCFKYSKNKRSHERVVHDGYAPFHCAHCDKRCGRKNELVSHICTQHFSGTQKQFKCAICDKSFALSKHLKSHKFVHMSQRPFKCSICDQRFKHLRNKSLHERKIHGEIDRFHCAHCEKVYSYKGGLSRHLQTVHV